MMFEQKEPKEPQRSGDLHLGWSYLENHVNYINESFSSEILSTRGVQDLLSNLKYAFHKGLHVGVTLAYLYDILDIAEMSNGTEAKKFVMNKLTTVLKEGDYSVTFIGNLEKRENPIYTDFSRVEHRFYQDSETFFESMYHYDSDIEELSSDEIDVLLGVDTTPTNFLLKDEVR